MSSYKTSEQAPYVVRPTQSGKELRWGVSTAEASRPPRAFDTKQEAVAYAREQMLSNARPGILIFDKQGDLNRIRTNRDFLELELEMIAHNVAGVWQE